MNKKIFEQSLTQRGINGDRLLDCMDLADQIEAVNGELLDDGIVVLYHATTFEKASMIIKEQKMYGNEDGIFFSTLAHGQICGYGDTVLVVHIPIEKLQLDDDFGNELHFRVAARKKQKIGFSITYLGK